MSCCKYFVMCTSSVSLFVKYIACLVSLEIASVKCNHVLWVYVCVCIRVYICICGERVHFLSRAISHDQISKKCISSQDHVTFSAVQSFPNKAICIPVFMMSVIVKD